MPYQRQTSSLGPVGIMQQHAAAEWLNAHRAQLQNGQWVAASGQGVQAQAPTIGELMSKVHKLPIEPDELAIAYITDEAIA